MSSNLISISNRAYFKKILDKVFIFMYILDVTKINHTKGDIMRKPVSFQKKEALVIWSSLSENKPLRPDPIAYKHKGSTIDEDGIRICGSKSFIESVLSRIKPLLEYEGCDTRIGIAWGEIVDKDSGQVIDGKFRCSVQVHERGREAKMVNRLFYQSAA